MRIFKITVHLFNLNKNSNKGILTSSDASFNSLNSRYVSKPAGAVPFNSHSKTFIRQRHTTIFKHFFNFSRMFCSLLQICYKQKQQILGTITKCFVKYSQNLQHKKNSMEKCRAPRKNIKMGNCKNCIQSCTKRSSWSKMFTFKFGGCY